MTFSFGSCIIHFSLLLFVIVSCSNAQSPPLPPPPPPPTTSRPTSIQFDTERDPITLQFMIIINQGTPLAAKKLVLDLGGKLPSLDCHKGYNSSSYKPVKCTSSTCALASKYVKCASCSGTGSAKKWCHKNACNIYTSNPVTHAFGRGELFTDFVTVKHNEGFATEPAPLVVPRRFAFGCATSGNFLQGLAKGAHGVAGLGHSSALSLVSQFAVGFRFSRIFALDLSSGGKMFFGGGPYVYTHGSDHDDLRKQYLTHTQLLINPKSPDEYFLNVKSILIRGETVPIVDKRLLSINKTTGVGGTKVDFQTPYTILQTSIYKAVTKVHRKWAKSMNITMVPPVAPFNTCYNASMLPDFVENINLPAGITFRFPDNGLRSTGDTRGIGNGVSCLAFVDGGPNPKTSIVIGKYNLNGFLEFDISRSRFGFLQPIFP